MLESFASKSHRPSNFLRALFLVYVFLIIYASLYPFTGWRDTGIFPLAYLIEAIPPRYWTWFDALINIVGYIPLGFLAVTAVSPKLKGIRALLFSIVMGVLLSFLMEAIQNYLPSRVPQNMDFVTNGAGTLIGAFLGLTISPILFREDRAHYFIQRWLRFGSSRVLIIPMLWPLAQIYPQNYLFGNGDILPVFLNWLSSLPMRSIDLTNMITNGIQLTPEQYWLSETIVTGTGMTGAVLLLSCTLAKHAPRIHFSILLVLIALLFKSLACALFFEPANAFVWLTPGAICGIFASVLILSGLIFTSSLIQRRIAIYMFFISLIVVNILPENLGFLSTLQMWSHGKFLNFNGAAYFVAIVWPFMALWFLFRSIYILRYSE